MITGPRNEPLSAHLTPQVKEALLMEANKRKTSMSSLVFQFVLDALRRSGYLLEDPKP